MYHHYWKWPKMCVCVCVPVHACVCVQGTRQQYQGSRIHIKCNKKNRKMALYTYRCLFLAYIYFSPEFHLILALSLSYPFDSPLSYPILSCAQIRSRSHSAHMTVGGCPSVTSLWPPSLTKRQSCEQLTHLPWHFSLTALVISRGGTLSVDSQAFTMYSFLW